MCGGTHVNALGDIALFKIIAESAVAAGVRRIEALTGEAARQWLTDREDRLKEAAATLKSSPEEVPARSPPWSRNAAGSSASWPRPRRRWRWRRRRQAERAPEQIGGHGFIGQVIEGLDPKGLRGLVDDAKARVGSGVVVLVAVNDGRATVAVGVTDDLSATPQRGRSGPRRSRRSAGRAAAAVPTWPRAAAPTGAGGRGGAAVKDALESVQPEPSSLSAQSRSGRLTHDAVADIAESGQT